MGMKLKKIRGTLLLVMMSIIFLTGCGDNKNLVGGKWTLVGVHNGGMEVSRKKAAAFNMSFEFKKDKTVITTINGKQHQGTYTLEPESSFREQIIIKDANGKPYKDKGLYHINDRVSLIMDNGKKDGDSISYSFSKSTFSFLGL